MLSTKIRQLGEKLHHAEDAVGRYLADTCELRRFWKTHSEQDFITSSYYPNEKKKSYRQMRREIEMLLRTRKASNNPQRVFNAYMILGMDCASRRVEDYLFGIEFQRLLDKKRPAYSHILHNKIFTLVYLSARGIAVSEILGQIDAKGIFHSMDNKVEMDFHEWLATRSEPVFCKQPDGFQGRSCFVLEREGDHYLVSGKPCTREELDAMAPQLQIETVIKQHEGMAAIYPGSVNTCRIVTVVDHGEIRFFSGYALFGCNGARVSNGCSGGLLISFDQTGKLGPFAVKELKFGGGTYTRHPNTGVVFGDCRIPYFEEALQLAIRAHETMPTIGSVGWDIAITPTGPIIIEGNRDWASVEHQIFRGGLRKEVESIFA